MSALAMTKMSSKGQVVIPDNIRNLLGLEPGSQFVVFAQDDTVILKIVTPPKESDLKEVMAKARSAARKAGLKKEDISKEIKSYRKKKKAKTTGKK